MHRIQVPSWPAGPTRALRTSRPSSSVHRRALGARLAGAALPSLAFLAGAGGVVGAQTQFHVSTTSAITLPGNRPVDDGVIVTAGEGAGSLPFFIEGHWQGVFGSVPSDIDAFGRVPSAPAGSAGSMAFSFLSNEEGFLDGDVITLASGGGLETLVSEAELLTALGVPQENIDLDAFDFDDAGCLYFSLQSDLSGTPMGTLLDGDVLCYDTVTGAASLFLPEGEIQQRFTAATGSSQSFNDVIGLDVVGGELWIVPQSPSAYDGAVIACGASPFVVIEEDDMGLEGAELDALSLVGPGENVPCFSLSRSTGIPGTNVNVELYGQPNTPYMALMSGGTGWIDFSARPGFGAWYFDPQDPWLNGQLGAGRPRFATTDANGAFQAPWSLPQSAVYGIGFEGEEGWSIQVLDLGSLELSAPFRVEKL